MPLRTGVARSFADTRVQLHVPCTQSDDRKFSSQGPAKFYSVEVWHHASASRNMMRMHLGDAGENWSDRLLRHELVIVPTNLSSGIMKGSVRGFELLLQCHTPL